MLELSTTVEVLVHWLMHQRRMLLESLFKTAVCFTDVYVSATWAYDMIHNSVLLRIWDFVLNSTEFRDFVRRKHHPNPDLFFQILVDFPLQDSHQIFTVFP